MKKVRLCLFGICVLLAACTENPVNPRTLEPPTSTPAPTSIPQATVQGDGVVIGGWEYFGPESVDSFPHANDSSRDVGSPPIEAWLIRTEPGFDLVWGNLPCAVHPVIVIHAPASIEFWPGGAESPLCEDMSVGHKLSIQWDTEVAFDEWTFTLHLPTEMSE